MALNIVRHDITQIKADAIVNSTNEHFAVGGLGVDASIHYAAGPKLKEALDNIHYCPVGSAVITESFNISTCNYIIHAVPPVYQIKDARAQNLKLLNKTYFSILNLARKKKCRSLAIPLLSAGANGYPKKKAYEIATGCIRSWLAGHYASEMEILLVLYDRDVVELSESIDHSLHDYITDFYTEAHKEDLREYYSHPEYRRNAVRDSSALEQRETEFALKDVTVGRASGNVRPNTEYSIDHYNDVYLSFAGMCEWWCEKKGIKKGQFFASSNITKATFSYMKLHPDSVPKKNTALACAVGLRLDVDQAKDLLMRAGLAFSKMFPTDRLVEQCIRDGKYNIDDINFELYEMGLEVLGYSKGA